MTEHDAGAEPDDPQNILARPMSDAGESQQKWILRSDEDAELGEKTPRRRRGSKQSSGTGGSSVYRPDEPSDQEPAGPDDEHSRAVGRWRQVSNRRNKPKRPLWVELPMLIVVAFLLTFLIQTFVAKVYYVPSGSMENTIYGAPTGGDRILANKVVYDFRDPRPGDVVVFKGPPTWDAEVDVQGPTSWLGKVFSSLGSVIGIAPANEKDFVKRVIAVGGQTVACCDAQGNVTVDGRSLSEPYIFEPSTFLAGEPSDDCTPSIGGLTYASTRCFAPFKVPAGQLWVMGDHRSDSSDSSYYCWGKTAAGEKAATANGAADCNRPIPASDVIGKVVFIVMPPSHWGTIGNPDIDPTNTADAGAPVTAALPVVGGVAGTLFLRGGLALTPTRRRRRKSARLARRARSAVRTRPGSRLR